ncbi:hypothetical protein OSG_eHP27_00130 [environmental Halophage eHP-27]|nr:hypothetical protein OSG_eHP27_00130 [environmental Halophage eHP-27]
MSDTVELPTDALAELARQQALLDSNPRVSAPDGADVDKWNLLKSADVDSVMWKYSKLHVWFEGETTLSRRVARATHWQPAEYANDPARVHVGIVWDFDPESPPNVEIEVVPE